ncbi:hypothetical protein PHLCEN_2v12997 [Hermanssonia centrifuga]|uniref:UFSP1/2/DUB catalytic domain-containing protein n=1 Tax=Hermanssonia centrifuga TaxID=98765 RepID=A0A2R6NFQ9_9APHY|nr:hypothetical protein PHLCEN_2v12997 [Hermanssonia centrifuga]
MRKVLRRKLTSAANKLYILAPNSGIEVGAVGYDEEGARQLHRKLVETTKWIGTAGPDILLNWIVNYFTQDHPKSANINDALRGAEPIVITNKMPLVLQHAGHSRTVIGYEKSEKGAITLLMFDPARKVALVNHSSSTPGHIEVHRLSPKKIVQKVLHPNRYKDSGSKRRASDAGNDSMTAKRLRAGSEKEVIVIDDDDDDDDIQMNAPVSGNNHESAPRIEDIDFSKVLKGIRVSPGTLG